ncbi:RNA polymerase sigma factor [Pseudoxanthomonas indica]|uniref:RNA polymerase sigma-70 factor, ECF subfamily n=1 Tax=Pseudoxanthomonas indica TaxID=428993 RepID=A0A1T5KGL1_9GAMM|nr:sigma-70 family RNA polymerase sigma factor [Pseudoxanthomonas indica]GGD49236.1 DNA-directed RNA polymerase sigma-70 factor [Pseudoxanthomonas indica]SKC62761.1 RNA polymerase sigma-70 factor, ECF subfamily [Pseudoxanthomonas indica]
MSESLDAWFAHEILIHEEALVAYLRRCWPHRDEVHDLRQEIYVRVYEAAGKSRPTLPKSFLFTTARHLMTDRVRRSRVVSIETMGDLEPTNVLVDEVSPERWCGGRQVLKRLSEAFDRLPDRCREVVWLRRVEELPQKEVAQRMGISEKTVEKHMAKGIRLIAEHFYGGAGARTHAMESARAPRQGQGHGQQQAD